ncbi:MAG TPA: hydroxymyristoyl-ACP dehydratase [Rhodanobacteraceae bacterium]|jgi:3-hydroxymyristoyl/3-hydroxydecanoyl-(acyl carrier protein) dehydratase|nr:hydroxymyristoyl-ACP dehydratase [Rhodanobacteraceae bacterium]
MSAAEFREVFSIAAAHAALPGHFPGRPVVPGVVLLDRVAAALERWRGARIAGLPQVKFLRPLLPEQEVELLLDDDGKSIRFRILHAQTTIASGSIEIAR